MKIIYENISEESVSVRGGFNLENEDEDEEDDEEEDFEDGQYYREDVFEDNNEYVISVNLLGVDKKNIIVDVVNGGILVKVMKITKYETIDEEKGEYSYSKSLAGFSRLFDVPDDADKNNVDVKYKNGVLIINIPKMKKFNAERRIE